MRKESEREYIYIYVKLSHFAVCLKLTQHCKSTVLQYKIKIKVKKNSILVLHFTQNFHIHMYLIFTSPVDRHTPHANLKTVAQMVKNLPAI